MVRIEKIIYDTTREIYSVEDKLSIAAIFLFADSIGSDVFSELLYTENHQQFIEDLNKKYSEYEIDLSVNFSNINVKNSFHKTLKAVIEKEDANGFYKALYEKDPYALVIDEICKFDFSKIKFKTKLIELSNQLKINI